MARACRSAFDTIHGDVRGVFRALEAPALWSDAGNGGETLAVADTSENEGAWKPLQLLPFLYGTSDSAQALIDNPNRKFILIGCRL